MMKYEKEIQFKNRVLKEREKRVFNDAMKHRMSKKAIKTNDLMHDRTLTNHRTSKRHLRTVNSNGSIEGGSSQAYVSTMHDLHNPDTRDMRPLITEESKDESLIVTPNTQSNHLDSAA